MNLKQKSHILYTKQGEYGIIVGTNGCLGLIH